MNAISLDTAIAITEISKRTLWRRMTEGKIARLGTDGRGRALVALEDIVPLLCAPIDPADYNLVIRADADEAEAQNDLGLLLMAAGKQEAALHWLQAAASQKHADAMHNLAQLHVTGTGVPKDQPAGLMWLAKAAAHGHTIAKQQMAALVPLE